MRQVEVSRTIVFDAPRHARGFFEVLVADNPGIGRSHNVEIIFARKVRRDTKGVFRTAIDRRDNGGVLVNVSCKHSRIKQYLKDGRAMRIETVINAPRDLGCNARLPNLDDLQTRPGHHPNSAPRYRPSPATSTITPTGRASPAPRET